MRSTTFTSGTVLGLGAAIGTLLARNALDHRASTRARSAELGFDDSGTSLDAIVMRSPRRDAREKPMLLFESGLLMPPESWYHIAQRLLMYWDLGIMLRPGLAGSRRALPLNDFSTLAHESSAARQFFSHGRKVVLVGHSLGGLIALASIRVNPQNVEGVVLIDSTNPVKFLQSQDRIDAATQLSSNFAEMIPSFRIGLGGALPIPDWVRILPPPVRASAASTLRDRRLWLTARDEWSATFAYLRSGPSLQEVKVEVPGLVLYAGQLAALDATHLQMQEHLGKLVIESQVLGVKGANHESILVNPNHARTVSDHILKFLR